MSKYIKKLTLLFVPILFLLLTSTALAQGQGRQNDFEGITPAEPSQPNREQQRSPVETAPNRNQRINQLKQTSENNFQNAQNRYTTIRENALILSNSGNDIEARLETHKANMALVAARYHKLLGTLTSLLNRIVTIVENNESNGFSNTIDEESVQSIETQISDTSQAITEFENLTNQTVETTDEAVGAYIQETQTKSAQIKAMIKDIKTSIVNLIRNNQ